MKVGEIYAHKIDQQRIELTEYGNNDVWWVEWWYEDKDKNRHINCLGGDFIYKHYTKVSKRNYKKITGKTFVNKRTGTIYRAMKKTYAHNYTTISGDLSKMYALQYEGGYIKYTSYYKLRKYYEEQ